MKMKHDMQLKKYFFYILSFMGGFYIMQLEMAGFRVMTTNFGSSIYTTGTFLTFVMIFLSSGYFSGGRLSEKYKTLSPMVIFLSVVSLYTFASQIILGTVLVDWAFGFRQAVTSPLLQATMPVALVSILFYGPPMVVLSQVSPYLIKLYCQNKDYRGHDMVGNVSGTFMAVSTIGSIIGSVVTSYFFIPFLGVRITNFIFIFSLLGLVTAALFLFPWGKRAANITVIAVLGVVALLLGYVTLPLVPGTPEFGLIHQEETLYGKIKIFKFENEGEVCLIYRPSRIYEHSVLYPANPLKDQFGLSYISPAVARHWKDYLVLGSAAGGNIIQLLASEPGVRITAVEIDPRVLEISKKFFNVVPSEKVKLVTRDARLFLADCRETFNYIIIDLFKGECIPVHCITSEFFQLVLNHLKPGGAMVINTNMNVFDLPYDDRIPLLDPLQHLYGTLYAAGFQSIFQCDYNWFTGMVYAFKQPVSAGQFFDTLYRAYKDPGIDVRVRANIGAVMLKTCKIFPTPANKRRQRPFTDDWVPEQRIHLNTYARDIPYPRDIPTAYCRLAKSTGWKRMTSQTTSSTLAQLKLNWYLSYWQKGIMYPFRKDYQDYYNQVAAWASRQKDLNPEELARYLSIHYQFYPQSLREYDSPKVRIIADYTYGLVQVLTDNGEAAIPYLDRAIEALYKKSPGSNRRGSEKY